MAASARQVETCGVHFSDRTSEEEALIHPAAPAVWAA